MFRLFKKKAVDNVEGGEVSIPGERENRDEEGIAENAVHQNADELKEKEKKEKLNRFISRMSSLMERVELLERKVDRLEWKLGIKNEEKEREEN